MSCKILKTGQVSFSDGVNCEDLNHGRHQQRPSCDEYKTCGTCLSSDPQNKGVDNEKKVILQFQAVNRMMIN